MKSLDYTKQNLIINLHQN